MAAEKSVGDNIREARNQARRSAEWVARQIGCSQSDISQLERGVRAPTPKKLRAIAKALGIDVYQLCTDAYMREHQIAYEPAEAIGLEKLAQECDMSELERMLLLRSYGKLTAEARRKAMAYMQDLAKITEYVWTREELCANDNSED